MSDTHWISIAGIAFRISSNTAGSRIVPPTIPSYEPFIPSHPPEFPDISVNVTAGPAPAELQSGNLRSLGNAGVWQLCELGEDYILTHSPVEEAPPLWTIRARPDFSELDAYFNQALAAAQTSRTSIPSPIVYPLDQLILIHYLARREGLLIHCAGLEYGDSISIFPGRSGAGKSTIANLLRSAQGIEMLSDDRVIVRREADIYLAHGTPWPGDAGIAKNRRAPLRGIYFLKQARVNKIVELDDNEALRLLLPVASIPWYDRDVLPPVLDLCGDMLASTPKYELHFTLDEKLGRFLTDECRL